MPDTTPDPAALRADRPLDRFTVQSCPAGKHADWAADSENAHACPWCEVEKLRTDLAQAQAERRQYYTALQGTARRAAMEASTPKPSRFTATPAQIDAFLRVHFCEDRIQLYQWAIGDTAAHEAAEEIRTHAQAKYDRDFSDNRIFHLGGSKWGADLIDPAKGGGHYPSVLVGFARRAAAADAGTVDGIRPHRPVTPEQDAQMKRAAEQLEKDNPITPERAVEMLYGQSATAPTATGGE